MDETDSKGAGHNGSRRPAKRPMKSEKLFMFIDSSAKGTNAKPDKAVRSFVMQSARRQKPWSTRQKNSSQSTPKSDSDQRSEAKPTPECSPSQTETQKKVDDAVLLAGSATGSWLEIDSSPTAWNSDHHLSELTSPVSSRTGSIASRSYSLASLTSPITPHERSCDIPYCTGASCGMMHPTHTALARREGFALGVLDPFDCLSVRLDAKSSSMIKHFVNIISPRLIPVDMHASSSIVTTQWLGNSLRDATSAPFTYAILTTSALQHHAAGTANLADVLYYKSMAISEINSLFSNERTCIDDNNIAAVFMLLCLEESQLAPGTKEHEDAEWSEQQRSIHLMGLKAMIEKRGGLAGLSSNRCLQTFLLMHSIAHSISTFQRPYATLTDANGQPQRYDLPSFRPSPASNRIMWLFRDLQLDPDLFDIISNIVVFVGDMSSWFEDRRCPVDPLELQKHASLLMYRLVDWFIKEGEEHKLSPVDQSVCLGLLIFLVKASQPFDASYHTMILTTVKKLRAALTKGNIFKWVKAPDLLLWTITMGALAAQGSAEASWFSNHCSVAFRGAGFDDQTSADELLDRMRKCLWVPMLFDEEAKRLWITMGIVQGEKETYGDEQQGPLSPEIKEEEVVGLLTSTRFFKKNS